MDKRSPKPSEIIEAIYDFCEEEKDISEMSLPQVHKALGQYGINELDAVDGIKKNIAKVKAKETLRDAAAKRVRQLKEMAFSIARAAQHVSLDAVKNELTRFFDAQGGLAFRNFSSFSDQDLKSIAADLQALDGVGSIKASCDLNQINPKAVAYRLTQLFFISEPKEIDLEAIAMARGVLVDTGMLSGYEARLIRKGDKGIIRVSDDLTPGQKRFAVAHELGHWEMHQGVSQWYLCTGENIANYNASTPEIQASAFAAEFLMPTKLFRPTCSEAEPSLALIRQLANDFETGLTATSLRFIELNENPCMIVLSDGKHVRWWRKNEKCGNAWFESKQEIGGAALAGQCFDGKVTVGQSVPYSAWFKHIETDDRDSIFEESIKFGNYNAVLTLLWFD